jgi:CRP-like cAMP-binding protein
MKVLKDGLATGPDADAFVAALRDVDFFETLDDDQLREALKVTKAVEYDPGEIVFLKDAAGDSFYLVRSGRAQARVPGFFGDKVIGEMGPGDFFGELALVLDRPRAATIVCTEAMVCLVLASFDFAALMAQHPDIESRIKDAVKRRAGKP